MPAVSAGSVDPDRFGVVFGADMIYCDPAELEPAFRSCIPNGKFDFNLWGQQALGEMFPLWMLKFLPNMPACHIAIANDARGPNNSVLMGEASSLLAMAEAVRLIERGLVDVVIAGGSRLPHPPHVVDLPRRAADVAAAAGTPSSRCGRSTPTATAWSSARGLRRSCSKAGSTPEPAAGSRWPGSSTTPARSRRRQRAAAAARHGHSRHDPPGSARGRSCAGDLDHVNANGLGTVAADRAEAQAIRAELGDVPVTARKAFSATWAQPPARSRWRPACLAFAHGQVPPTLNYDQPDPECPVQRRSTASRCPSTKPYALLLNQATTGQAVALLIARET